MIKNIALVAHDARKAELVNWVEANASYFQNINIFCTGTTGKLVAQTLDKVLQEDAPEVNRLLSGPLGGDAQISAMIAEQRIDLLIFFCDNLIMQGHQNDIMGLVRLASLYNIPFATNVATADFILRSPLFTDPNYEHIVPKCIENYRNRKI